MNGMIVTQAFTAAMVVPGNASGIGIFLPTPSAKSVTSVGFSPKPRRYTTSSPSPKAAPMQRETSWLSANRVIPGLPLRWATGGEKASRGHPKVISTFGGAGRTRTYTALVTVSCSPTKLWTTPCAPLPTIILCFINKPPSKSIKQISVCVRVKRSDATSMGIPPIRATAVTITNIVGTKKLYYGP